MALSAELRDRHPGHPLVEALTPVDAACRWLGGALEVRTSLTSAGSATVLDLTLELEDVVLHTMRGGRFEAAYPPKAYAPVARVVHPGLPFPWAEHHATLAFGSQQGRSSDEDMPFFWLGDADGRHSLWFAIGWSGYWRARLVKLPGRTAHRLTVTVLDGSLEPGPGESIELPRVLVGAGGGDGWQEIRTCLMDLRPRPAEPWVVYNSFFNENLDITEERLQRHLAVAADLGVEVFTIDAGWYDTGGYDGQAFQTPGLGTWAVDEKKFPRGLRAFADDVHAAGLLFGLWFDPERAHPDSAVVQAHPEWLIMPEPHPVGVLDLSIEAAQSWVVELLSAAVRDWGVDWLKWDFNTEDVRAVWRGDARRELGHVRGIYAILDELRRRHPDLRIEMCAGGGNRVDLEMLVRSDSFWISDQTISPPIVRETVLAARRVLPAQYCYLSVSPQVDPVADDYPDAWFLSVMAGVFGVMDRLGEWPPQLVERVTQHIADFKRLRPWLDGSVLDLSEPVVGSPLVGWRAWEVTGDGGSALLCFRQHSPQAQMSFTGSRDWQVELPPGGARLLVEEAS